MKGNRFVDENEEEDSTTTENIVVTDNLSAADDDDVDLEEEANYAPSPKKRKKGVDKKVVTVPINGGGDSGDGFRSKGSEVYPPPDSWSWRKYGQKPIKGSPYPRGYYRCSSSKGCPAKKQVERSRLDPTTLVITYSCEHNHSLPAKNHHHQNPPTPTSPPPASTSPSSSPPPPPPNFPPEECAVFANQPDIEPPEDSNSFVELAGELGWLCEMGSTMMDGIVLDTRPMWASAEVEVFMPIGEEDKVLFGDLGDLPESAEVFRRCSTMEMPCCGGTS